MKYLLIGLTILLTACSGSDNSPESSDESKTSELNLEIMKPTYCGGVVPAANAELIIYDADWQMTHRFKPDNNGKIVGTIPHTSHTNLSFIEKTDDETGQRLLIDSYAEYPIGNLGRFTVSGEVQGDCECAELELQVNLPDENSSRRRVDVIGGTSSGSVAYSTSVNNIQVCREPSASWPDLIVKTTPSSGGGLYYTQLTDYTPSDVYTVDLVYQAEYRSINISPHFTNAHVLHLFNNGRATDNLTNLAEYTSLVNIPSLEGTFIQAYSDESVQLNAVNLSQFLLVRKKVNPASNQTEEVAIPETSPFASLADMFVKLLLTDDMNYKVDNAGGYTGISAYTNGVLSNGFYYVEYFTGPLEGVIPENALPIDYGTKTFDEGTGQFSGILTLFSYPLIGNYTAYANENIKRSTLSPYEWFDGKWAEYESISLEISN